jgi:ElaB/YqjD/DUF883 family membrane-anchored ribosome-binding protein
MMDPLARLRAATAQTKAQRLALRQRAAQTVDRLAPPRLAEDAIDAAADLVHDTGQQVRAHPFTAAGVIALAGIALFHRPLGRLVDRWLDRIDPPADEEPQLVEEDDAQPVSDG